MSTGLFVALVPMGLGVPQGLSPSKARQEGRGERGNEKAEKVFSKELYSSASLQR